MYLVRGNLSVLLAQDRAYWLNLYVFPDEVRGETIPAVTVRGQVDRRARGSDPSRGLHPGPHRERLDPGRQGRPTRRRRRPWREALARLEGEDLLEAGAAPGAGAAAASPGGLEVAVSTLDGRDLRDPRVGGTGSRLLLQDERLALGLPDEPGPAGPRHPPGRGAAQGRSRAVSSPGVGRRYPFHFVPRRSFHGPPSA